MNRNAYVGALMLVLLVLVAPAAIAGKGGNGNGNGGGNGNGNGNGNADTAPATVNVSPNPAAAGGARVEVTGCGYDTEYAVELRVVHSAGYTEAWGVGVWGDGCINPTPLVTSEAGTYTVEVYQRSSKDLSLKASADLSVVP